VVGLSGTMIPDMRPAWVTYLAVDDADAFARGPAAGGTVVGPPMDIADQGRMALATDPAGAFFGSGSRAVHTGSELVNEPGTVVWNELVAPASTRRPSSTGPRRCQLRGPGRVRPDHAGLQADQGGGRTVGGAMPPTPEMGELPPHWGIYFEVADADAAVKQAQDLGARVLSRVQPTPQGPMATLADPQGGGLRRHRLGSDE
jgi:predicted enzyme related to lactoylglutathione lyase